MRWNVLGEEVRSMAKTPAPANVPSGSKEREKYPAHVFLDPSRRRYPYKRWDSKSGKWKISCADLADARRLALMHKEQAIADKALRLAKKYDCRWAK